MVQWGSCLVSIIMDDVWIKSEVTGTKSNKWLGNGRIVAPLFHLQTM